MAPAGPARAGRRTRPAPRPRAGASVSASTSSRYVRFRRAQARDGVTAEAPLTLWTPHSRRARAPEVIGAAHQALGQEATGALGVAAAEGRLEERVVEHIALRAAAAQLDDPRPQRLDARDGARVIAGGEGVQA